jgi:very-short-patch-repair endonuclease
VVKAHDSHAVRPSCAFGRVEMVEAHGGDRAIARAAAQQHGMVTLAQLAAAGLGRGAVAHRVARGRLTPRFRGVYQVGPIQAEHGREAAAVLAAGPGALLSHHTAAAIWGFTPDHPGDVHVTVPSDARSRPGLTLHRSASLNAAVHNGLPLTTPARTLHDLARVLARKDLDRAVEEALIRGLATPEQLTTRPALREATATEPTLTRSEAERQLRALIKAANLPAPATNVRVAGHEVDAYWPRQRLVAEVDGYKFHGGRAAFERDRRKDGALTAAGYTVVRVTWRQIKHEPHAVVALLARLLPP